MRIDAHHHVWDLSVRDQEWTADLPALRRSFTMDDLRPALDPAGVAGTVLVQTVPVPEETPELLAVAASEPRVLGVVGWVDLTCDPGRLRDEIERLRGLPGGSRLVGVRHPVQGESDPRWLLREDVLAGLAVVAGAGLAYDLLVLHHQLPAAVELVGRLPGLRFVLDHAGKPPVAAGDPGTWAGDLAALAQHQNVACKLSGLLTEDSQDWSVRRLRPYAEHVLGSFGAHRVMAGSDWPVSLLRASYDEVVTVTHALVQHLSPSERSQVLGATAEAWYALGDPGSASHWARPRADG